MIRLAARTLKHLLLTIALLVGGLCALEVGLRVTQMYSNAQVSAVDAMNIALPSRETYLAVPPGLLVRARESKKSTPHRVRSNSFGLRNAEVDIPRDSKVFRILCLGDETTLAPELAEPRTYARLLKRELEEQSSTDVEVLNAGCPGASPTVEALLLRHRLLTLQPDLILLHLDPSDLADEEGIRRHVQRDVHGFPISATHPALSGRSGVACQLDQQFLIVRTLRESVFDMWKKGRPGLSHEGRSDSVDESAGIEGDPIENIRLALLAIQRMAKSQSAELLVTTTAHSSAADRRRRSSGPERNWPPQELVDVCSREGISLFDATPDVLAAGSGPASTKRLTAAAHAEYASVLSRHILRRFAGEESAPPVERISDRVETRSAER